MMKEVNTNYKYLTISIILILIVNSVLIFFSGDPIKWYVYAVSCLIAFSVLKSRGYTISLDEKGVKIKGIFKVSKFRYSDIERISLFQDMFFYKRTTGIILYLKDKTRKKYFIGTLPSSEIHKLQEIFNNNIGSSRN